MEYNQDNNQQSKFNSGVSQLYRIDTLWQQCHQWRNAGDLEKWNNFLDTIWTEIAADTSPEERGMFERYSKLLSNNQKILNPIQRKNSLYTILMNKEIWLRKVQNSLGLGTAYTDPELNLMT